MKNKQLILKKLEEVRELLNKLETRTDSRYDGPEPIHIDSIIIYIEDLIDENKNN